MAHMRQPCATACKLNMQGVINRSKRHHRATHKRYVRERGLAAVCLAWKLHFFAFAASQTARRGSALYAAL